MAKNLPMVPFAGYDELVGGIALTLEAGRGQAAWAAPVLATLLAYNLTKWNAHFCAIVDLFFVGALIAGVYYLRGITGWDCVTFPSSLNAQSGIDLGFVEVSGGLNLPNFNKTCSMLKASFAFGIMNIFFFFTTFVRPSLVSSSGRN